MIRARAKGWIMSTAIPTRMIMAVGIITITAIIVTAIAMITAMRITRTGHRITPVQIKPREAVAYAAVYLGSGSQISIKIGPEIDDLT